MDKRYEKHPDQKNEKFWVLNFFCLGNHLKLLTSLLLIMTLRFPWGERKIWSAIKNSQNIMNKILARYINI